MAASGHENREPGGKGDDNRASIPARRHSHVAWRGSRGDREAHARQLGWISASQGVDVDVPRPFQPSRTPCRDAFTAMLGNVQSDKLYARTVCICFTNTSS